MMLDSCFGNKSTWRILVLYGESPGAGFTRQDLKNHTKLGNKALTFALQRLVAYDILIKSKNPLSRSLYKLNNGNKYVSDIISLLEKEREDLNHLPYHLSLIVREVVREVIDSIHTNEIYLFGSIAKRTYRDDSDLDIAIVTVKKEPKDDLVINTIADKLSKKFERNIQCFLLTKEQFKNRSTLVQEILKHGIRLV